MRFRSIAFALAFATACGPADDLETQEPVVLPADEARLVLALVNDPRTTVELLDRDVELERRAAENLIAYRSGADGVYPSDDDRPFRTVDDLDAVPYVGDVALTRLRDYAVTHAPPPAETVEGVVFTSEQVAAVLYGVNGASTEELDVEVGLAADAAAALRAGRPYMSIGALAAVANVGPDALATLRDHAVVWAAELSGAVSGMAGVYDGVTFDDETAQAALAAAQTATLAQLQAAGLATTGAKSLVAGRPYLTLQQVAAASGVGQATMAALRGYAEDLL